MKYLLLILFILQSFTFDLNAQKWIENDVTKFLKNKWVSDICFQKDITWILTTKGLFKYYDNKFENYIIDSLSSGPLSQYRAVKEQYNDQFNYITGNDSILWIFSVSDKTILKLANDTLTNFKPEFLKNVVYGILDYCIDEKGVLWFSFSERDTTQKDEYFGFKNKYNLAYYNGQDFSIYPIPEHLSRYFFYSFKVKNNSIYFLCPNYENERGLVKSNFYILKNSFLDSINLDVSLGMSSEIYFFNDTAYILTGNDKVFTIYNNYIIENINLRGIGLSFKSELSLINNKLYVTSGNGLYIYDLQNKKT